MLDRAATGDAESARLASNAWRGFVRFVFRFLCAAALIAAGEIYRRRTGRMQPIDRRVVGTIISFGSAGLLGLVILWKSRAGAVREVLDSAAMMGFWTGFFALFA